MPSSFDGGQQALIEKISIQAFKTFQEEHAKEREQEMELLIARISTDRRVAFTEHTENCSARKTTGRLRTWAPVCIVGAIAFLAGAGAKIVNWSTLVKWIARL